MSMTDQEDQHREIHMTTVSRTVPRRQSLDAQLHHRRVSEAILKTAVMPLRTIASRRHANRTARMMYRYHELHLLDQQDTVLHPLPWLLQPAQLLHPCLYQHMQEHPLLLHPDLALPGHPEAISALHAAAEAFAETLEEVEEASALLLSAAVEAVQLPASLDAVARHQDPVLDAARPSIVNRSTAMALLLVRVQARHLVLEDRSRNPLLHLRHSGKVTTQPQQLIQEHSDLDPADSPYQKLLQALARLLVHVPHDPTVHIRRSRIYRSQSKVDRKPSRLLIEQSSISCRRKRRSCGRRSRRRRR